MVRGRFLAMKNDDFVVAARLDGAQRAADHLPPHAALADLAHHRLADPGDPADDPRRDRAVSFLGLGLQPPAISWGVLLKEAQNIRSISQAPWLFIPGGFVVIAVLAFNFLGDGMRDAADPYEH